MGTLQAYWRSEQRARNLPKARWKAALSRVSKSYLIPEHLLEWLEESDQLHGAGALNNAWGFIPGEAAGAAMLLGRAARLRLEIPALGRVLSVGTGAEQNRIKTETVCTGEGLTAAFRQALTALPSDAQVTDVYCDMNGEPYRADELCFACLRTKAAFGSASDFIAPADCWGDVAAASISLAMILSSIAGAKSYANGAQLVPVGQLGERRAWRSLASGPQPYRGVENAAPVDPQIVRAQHGNNDQSQR